MPYNEDKTKFNGHKIFIKDDYECIDDGHFKYVHRLIMEEYLGRKLESFEEIHHKDENKRRNEISNFEISSKGEHTRKHDQSGKFPLQIGSLNSQAKLTEDQVIQIINSVNSLDDIQRVADEFSVHYMTIWGIYKEKTWKHVPRVAHR